MSGRPPFTLVFSPEAIGHLERIERKDHRLIRETVDAQLRYVPEEATRNRKPVQQPAPFGATWELRFGPRNHLWIGREEFEL